MLLTHLTVFVFGLLLGSFSVVCIIRRFYILNAEKINYYETNLKIRQNGVNEMVYSLNHYGLSPILKRCLGLLNLCCTLLKRVKRNLSESKNNLALARRPDHHRYADLVQDSVDKVDSDIVEMEDVIAKAINEIKDLDIEHAHTILKIQSIEEEVRKKTIR